MILPGWATGSANFRSSERAARRGRRLLGEIGERFEIAIAAPQPGAEIVGRAGVGRLQIDDVVALDHAEPPAFVFETDDFHPAPFPAVLTQFTARAFRRAARLSAFTSDEASGKNQTPAPSPANVKAWMEK